MTVHNHKKTDAEVQQDVLSELKWDTRVEPTPMSQGSCRLSRLD